MTRLSAAVKTRVRGFLHQFGVDVVPYDGRYFVDRKRIEIVDRLGVDLVLDVGANTGQYALGLRREGYDGHIVSFEPLYDAYASLCSHADRNWNCHRVALGASEGRQVLHRARNSWSSSLRAITRAHVDAAPDAAFVSEEQVAVRTLDSFGYSGRIYLKIDAQGFEREVLQSAAETLTSVVGIELELSIVQLYEGQALFGELLDWTYDHRFCPVSLTREFADPRTGEILQLNGIFARRDCFEHL